MHMNVCDGMQMCAFACIYAGDLGLFRQIQYLKWSACVNVCVFVCM